MTTKGQAQIDEEITKQILSLCNLRTQRNTFSLISRLPTETLATIFVHCARDYHWEASGHLISTAPSWVNVSYVCRRWRDVALNCPTLWTYLFMTSPRWTEELLARSKQASLKLHVRAILRDKKNQAQCLTEQVLDHVERIQELRLHILSSQSSRRIFSKLSSRVPLLQTLEVSARSGIMGKPFEWHSVPFDGDTPALRTIVLSHFLMPWHSFKLSGLTTLALYHLPVGFQHNMEEFLAILSCTQSLTGLYLVHVLTCAAGFLSSSAFRTFQKIDLPHLFRFWINAPLSTVIAFLSCVNIPLKTEIRLEWDLSCDSGPDSSLDDYALLCSLLAQRYNIVENQALSSLTIRSFVINFASPGQTTLLSSSLERDCKLSFDFTSHRDWDRNIPLYIGFHFSPSISKDNGHRIISDICRAIPLTNVQSLHVLYPPTSLALWKHTFGRLQDLLYIRLSYGDMPDLASMLSLSNLTTHKGMEDQDEQADRGPNQIFAPALMELELSNMSFSGPESRTCDRRAADQQSLYDALSTRKSSQGRLAMIRCTEYVGGLKKQFSKVEEWKDGQFHVVSECDLGFLKEIVNPEDP